MKPRKNTVKTWTVVRDSTDARTGQVRRSRSVVRSAIRRIVAIFYRPRRGSRFVEAQSQPQVPGQAELMGEPQVKEQSVQAQSLSDERLVDAGAGPAGPEPRAGDGPETGPELGSSTVASQEAVDQPEPKSEPKNSSNKIKSGNFLTQVGSLLRHSLGRSLAQFLASLTFYTLLPIPFPQHHEFHRIARFAPWVGLLLGLALGIADWGLGALGMNAGLRTAIVVVSWLGLTGGLHMDGAMDSADGLAVTDPKRRLAVMSDSVTGAFGAMVAMSLLLLKFAALMALPVDPVSRTVALMAAMGWGRWGQVLAIDRYVYLRVEGKGAFHKRQFRSPDDLWPGLIALLGLSALFIWLFPFRWILAVGMVLGGFAIAFGMGAWFDRQLGGHTGDTYGAVVEWTEALLLCLLTLL